MKRFTRDLAFWLAVGLAGAFTTATLKVLAARYELPGGAEEIIGTL